MALEATRSRQLGPVVQLAATPSVPRIRIGDSDLAICLRRVLPPTLADFIDVAAELFKVDRLAQFDRRSNGNSWTRHIQASLSVQGTAGWNDPKARERLTEILECLTDDHWDFKFRRRVRPLRPSEDQHYLFPRDRDPNAKIALLSGGLDSFAGIAAELAANPTSRIYCVSVVTNGRWERCQRDLANRLRDWHQGTLRHVRFKFHLLGADSTPQRSLRRTRGLLFLASGLVTAFHVGATELLIFENGVGAINLPYDRGFLGQSSSKAVHTRTLRLVEELFAMMSGRRITVRNPCELQTKAEMCRALPRALHRCIERTYSCDTFGARRESTPQCGTCTSCILRILSLQSAGLGKWDPMPRYQRDALSLSSSDERRHMRGLTAMNWQVERLARSIAQNEPWRALVSEFPDLAIVADELEQRRGRNGVKGEIIGLYRRYCDEFRCYRKNRPPEFGYGVVG